MSPPCPAPPPRGSPISRFATPATGGSTLYATTRYGGTLSAWDISPTGPTAINAVAHNRGDAAGTVASLGFIDTAGGPAVLTGGGDGGPLTLVQINTNGGLGGLDKASAPYPVLPAT